MELTPIMLWLTMSVIAMPFDLVDDQNVSAYKIGSTSQTYAASSSDATLDAYKIGSPVGIGIVATCNVSVLPNLPNKIGSPMSDNVRTPVAYKIGSPVCVSDVKEASANKLFPEVDSTVFPEFDHPFS